MSIVRQTNIESFIISRIMAASKESPIAVFNNGDKTFNVVFADTIESQKQIKSNAANLIGVYDRSHVVGDKKQKLIQHLRVAIGLKPKSITG